MLRLSLRPNVIAAYLSAAMICAMGWLAYGSLGRASDAAAHSHDTIPVMNALRAVDDQVRDATAAERDLVSTGDAGYATAYATATDAALRSLADLRGIAAPYRGADIRVDSLGYFVHLRIAEMDEVVRTARESAATPPSRVVPPPRDDQPDRKVTELLASIAASVVADDSRVAAGTATDKAVLLVLLLALSLLAVLLALYVNAMHTRNVRAQQRMTDALQEQSVQLQIQANELTATNQELERATAEMLRQTIEAERSETRLAGILGSATDAVVSFDDDERIVYFNAAARRLFGMDESAVAGERILRTVAERSVQTFEEHMLAARRSAHIGIAHPEVWDTVIARADAGNADAAHRAAVAAEVPVEVSMAYTRSGKQGLFTAVLRDVTRQRQLEDEFRQAQKMEAVGRLAGGIAHDFNNLLTVIGASSDFLLHDLRDDTRSLSADVREIRAATDRAASLTRQLLTFSRRQLVQPQLLDLNVVMFEMESMLQRLIGEDTTLATDYADGLGLVRLDRGQLEQVVVNLVLNARDAMPGGGVVKLGSGVRSVTTAGVVMRYATLTVADSGIGIDEATHARIFEPFFTTKEQGKGTGLGLSTVYGIVKASGGDIVVESEPGAGTEFRLEFPCVDNAPVTPPVKTIAPDTLRGFETVLVVEDEEPLRRLTRRILESRGYAVLDAANGNEAILVLAGAQTRVHLVLSDVVMPGMGGRELVERVLPVYPWLRVLFMSGYTEDTMLQHRVAELGIRVVEKPFTRDDLVLAVRSALDHSGDAVPVG